MHFWGAMATLTVSDVDKAVQFYTQKLGFEANFDNGTFVIVNGSQSKFTIELASGQNSGNRNSPSIGIGVNSAEEAMQELKNKGVEFTSGIIEKPPYFKLAYFKDPDGNPFYVISGQLPFPPASSG
jgi:catechol 2,3-dioxygenase-like lactoylglutathione lyase family enzyme